MKWLVLANAAVYILFLLLRVAAPGLENALTLTLGLVPALVVKGWIWQLATYSFLHSGVLHVLFNLLILFMIGSAVEGTWGSRRFLRLYLFSVVGAALTTVAFSYAGFRGFQPETLTVGASGGVFGVLMVFAILFKDQSLMFFPLPIAIKARYYVAILVLINIAGMIESPGGVAYMAHLGGLFFGYVYYKLFAASGSAPARAGYVGRGLSDRYAHPAQRRPQQNFFARKWNEMRDSYYRWKRRRAARKFEVYMKKHDRSVYFDEYGNYKGTEPLDKDDGERRDPWVN